jgi:uncharacterized protein with ParB-like and HNH nuclease domain/predicted transport protein
MKAVEAPLLGLLRKSPQFLIPIYQRMYSWTERECRQLWDDVLRIGSQDTLAVHFLGSIVYIESGLSQVTQQSPLFVIDGQQRLTTVTLLIAALEEILGDTEPLDGFSARKLRNYYLLNPEEKGERHYKLLLSQTDKASLIAVVMRAPQPSDHSLRIGRNFKLFQQLVATQKSNLLPLCKGIAKLVIVDIALNRDQDNPQLIFESMNSTGRELSQADLIRNFILMNLDPEVQTRLYLDYWHPMESDFGQEAYGTHFDSFMRHFLTVKTGEIPNVGAVYDAFKAYARLPEIATAGIDALLKDLREYAGYFCAMALNAETNPELSLAFHDLRELKVDVAYPFLLELYRDYSEQKLSREDLVAALRLVEAYVFRRAISVIPTNSLNKTFATFGKFVRKDRYLESIQAHFLNLPSYRRFPNDDEFRKDIKTRDLYNFRSRSYWLRRLENHNRRERVPVDQYTIEHILPQNENLSPSWQLALGPEWKRIQRTWLHTLGNLTLTGYNSQYSDHTFIEKRDYPEGGFKVSPLKLNAGLGQLNEWNEESIKMRAGRLAELAVSVWKTPQLSPELLDTYREQPTLAAVYTIDHHPKLLRSPMREVFDAFRKEVLALDPCVTQEFLKRYVAFKAESNFVDVVPHANWLSLFLNMPFADILDPEKRCKDVTEVGHWGNGDTEVGLRSEVDLPYVLGLVRQSLERQIGNGDDT